MSELVKEEPIGNGYVKVSFDGCVFLVLHTERGFFNPAPLCRRADRELCKYYLLDRKDDLELVLKGYDNEACFSVDEDVQNPLIAGCYFHPTLLLDMARLVSPDAFAAVAIIVGEIFNETERHSQLSNLLKCSDVPRNYRTVNTDPLKWRIWYTNLEFIVDNRGWFNASQFCIAHNKTRADFEKRTVPARFIEYLRRKEQFGGKYYHPMLFLLLAQWVDLDYFVKCVRVVFYGGDEILDALFRKAFRDLQPPGRSREELEEELARLQHQVEHERRESASARDLLNKTQEQMKEAEAEMEKLRRDLKQTRLNSNEP